MTRSRFRRSEWRAVTNTPRRSARWINAGRICSTANSSIGRRSADPWPRASSGGGGMTVRTREIPQPVALDGMLRRITECLAQELGCPTQIAPDWSEFEWIVARAVAAMHGVSPLLARALRWQGPAGWAGLLEEQRAHTAKRHIRIDDLLLRLDQRAR